MTLRVLFVVMAVVMWAGGAHARDAYPNKPIKVLVGFPAGGSTDGVARVIANYLSEKLPSRVFIENKPGAGAILAADAVAKSQPDGYTLLFTQIATHGIGPAAYAKLPYDPIADFKPVSFIASAPLVLLARKDILASNFDELLKWADKQDRPLSIGYFGNGTSAHLAATLLAMKSRLKLLLVPYRGGAPAMQDIVSGQIDLAVDVVNVALPQIEAGTVRAIGVTSKVPSSLLPGVEPLANSAPGIDIESWFGVVAPAQTPQPVVDRLASDLASAVADPKTQETLMKLGVLASSSSPAEFEKFIRDEISRWKTIVEAANIKVE